ncbi:hypothetical protein DOTSEDRAFT_89264 [Dothistroma septosporum NZE10]|uniref:UBX domain-containing protein n=1 Tax=Dothistroma septosporum (strain NZE10 / CBS 128990) TaxID=675120 RepID=M2XLT2_DOTSN|nr:hypothetical protein DOTSEDRAFT_89264 [Dothistroma septosporum NZE10]
MADSQDDKIAQFSSVTGANPSIAQNALAAANWNLEEAITLYYAEHEDQPNASDEDIPQAPTAQPTQPQPTSSSSSRTMRGAPAGSSKMKTIRDLQGGGNEDEDEDKPQDMFAGGEKSGLAVQNPGEGGQPIDHFRNIMNQARQNRERPPGAEGEEDEQPRSTAFSGRAQTLGGDDAPSEVVEDPAAPPPSSADRQRPPRVSRTLHLWADGVSIDDGPLLRFDDPANEHIMQEINQGRAPKALLDVQPDQEVDLNLDPHKGENYVQPKPKYKPFGGQGNRLGAPTPGLATSSGAASSSSSSAAPPAASSESVTQQSNIDESQPTIQLQIRLGDGTRLVSRFNTSMTIGDVYSFVDRAASQPRSYVLMTTFPSKELSDKSQVLGDMSDFQRGGTVVQKWT